jgi:hypothetical protein
MISVDAASGRRPRTSRARPFAPIAVDRERPVRTPNSLIAMLDSGGHGLYNAAL